MKAQPLLIALYLIALPLLSFSQKDTVYLNVRGEVENPTLATHYRVRSFNPKAQTEFIEEYDALSGHKKRMYMHKKLIPRTLEEIVVTGFALITINGATTGEYKSLYKEKPIVPTLDSVLVKHGNYMEWYPSGTIKTKCSYINGFLHGEVTTFHPNGKPKQIETYKLDTLQKGQSFDSLGVEIAHTRYYKPAEFAKGKLALYQFLGETIIYEKEARENGIQGIVFVSFMVDKQGHVTDINPMKGASPILVKECLRVVKAMPKWKPAYLDGEPVSSSLIMPIKFIMN